MVSRQANGCNLGPWDIRNTYMGTFDLVVFVVFKGILDLSMYTYLSQNGL